MRSEHRVDNVLFFDTSNTNDCDGNGVPDACDPDADGDGVPDGCDLCQGDDASGDSDGDGVCDDTDACPGFDDSVDSDGDGVADGCDACPGFDDTSTRTATAWLTAVICALAWTTGSIATPTG